MPTDHDLLIGLDVKVERLIADVKDISSNMAARIGKIEGRLDANDKYHAGIDMDRYNSIARWGENLRANFRIIILGGGLVVALLEAFLIEIVRKVFGI